MKPKIVLASGSPRRKELLARITSDFIIDPANFDERSVTEKSAEKLVETLALKKAQEVASRHSDSIIIGADLIVAFEGRQLGKPENAAEAKVMLQLLRGKTNQVITGVALINTENGKTAKALDIANVTMRNYSDSEIDDYIATGEPRDKAGAYAIQGIGRKLIDDFDGDLEGIIGLSTKTVKRLMEEIR